MPIGFMYPERFRGETYKWPEKFNCTVLHNYKDFWIYVSEGSGTWGPPMRIGTKSEIALIRLRKNRGDSSTKTI